MSQVGGNGPGEELLQPSPYATPSAADDDHLDIEDVGQPGERVRNVACQLSKGQVNGIVSDRCTDLGHQPLIEVSVLEFGQVRIEGKEATVPSGSSSTTYRPGSTCAQTRAASNVRAKRAAWRSTTSAWP